MLPPFVHVGHLLLGNALGPFAFVLGACALGVVVVSDEVDEASVGYGVRDYVLCGYPLPMSERLETSRRPYLGLACELDPALVSPPRLSDP